MIALLMQWCTLCPWKQYCQFSLQDNNATNLVIDFVSIRIILLIVCNSLHWENSTTSLLHVISQKHILPSLRYTSLYFVPWKTLVSAECYPCFQKYRIDDNQIFIAFDTMDSTDTKCYMNRDYSISSTAERSFIWSCKYYYYLYHTVLCCGL